MEIKPEIIYQDKNCLVVSKPIGWLTVGRNATCPSLEDWIWREVPGNRKIKRMGIVHRLDRDTSGGVLVALEAGALEWFSSQFKGRLVDKYYWCLVSGKAGGWGKIEMPIGIWRNRGVVKRKVDVEGKMAVSEYWLEANGVKDNLAYSWLRVKIYTGRTHQIRVHLAYLGWPIVGDRWYGKTKEDRLMLHAGYLGINSPDGKRIEVKVALPKKMREILKKYDIKS